MPDLINQRKITFSTSKPVSFFQIGIKQPDTTTANVLATQLALLERSLIMNLPSSR
jgi:hypothetical protein